MAVILKDLGRTNRSSGSRILLARISTLLTLFMGEIDPRIVGVVLRLELPVVLSLRYLLLKRENAIDKFFYHITTEPSGVYGRSVVQNIHPGISKLVRRFLARGVRAKYEPKYVHDIMVIKYESAKRVY